MDLQLFAYESPSNSSFAAWFSTAMVKDFDLHSFYYEVF